MSRVSDWLRQGIHAGSEDGPEKPGLTLGFIPLTDCAPLAVALEQGFFAKYGLDVRLSRETSWANIRDKLAIGILDGAHMLAPMTIGSTLGLGPIEKPTITALSLDLNGNAITISNELYRLMLDADPAAMAERPLSARALKNVIEARRQAGEAPLTFAMVFPLSGHNYALRYWMAASGIDPDRDVRLIVVPPPQMVSNLRAGNIDGFCVGEPWNEVAVSEGLGRVAITSYEIWNNGPEKVFGVNLEWAERYPNTHRAVLMALLEAARWVDAPENRLQVVEIISGGGYINAPPGVVKMSMAGTYQYAWEEDPRPLPDFNVFYRFGATFPWLSHAEWLLTQMLRWGQIDQPLPVARTAASIYRPDIYRDAAAALGIPTPLLDRKIEGINGAAWTLERATAPLVMGCDRFLDARVFDPADPVDYLRGFEVGSAQVDMEALASLNPVEACVVGGSGAAAHSVPSAPSDSKVR